jgi:hypothetical protein
MGITNFLFNTVTLVFLVLTLIVGLVVVMVAAGSMESPVLAPADTDVPPTLWVGPTLTPSPGPPPPVTPTVEVTPTPAPAS